MRIQYLEHSNNSVERKLSTETDTSNYLSTLLKLNQGNWKLVHQEILFFKQARNNQAFQEGVNDKHRAKVDVLESIKRSYQKTFHEIKSVSKLKLI